MSSHTYRVGAGDLAKELRNAFEAFRKNQARVGILVLPDSTRPRVDLVDVVVNELHASPALERLTIVHPSPSLGFFASSIGLRAGRTRVSSCATIDAAVVERRASRPPPPSRFEVVRVATGQDVAMALAPRLLSMKERGLTGCAVVLPPDSRPSSDLVGSLAELFETNKQVSMLVLIHPSASLGFLASAVGLRLPRVKVHALREERELESLEAPAVLT